MKFSNRQNGFTLIELLVVLVILGLLAGLVGPQVLRYTGSAKSDTAGLQIEELGAGLDLFHLEVGRYPTTDEGLKALVEQPTSLTVLPVVQLRKPLAILEAIFLIRLSLLRAR